MSAPASPQPTRRAPRGWLLCIGILTAATLTVSLPLALFDTNFYSLFEATGLLAGDHPYRDFFEWGIPLQAAFSAAVQRLVGYRMVGEFVLIHWTAIIAGAVLSFAIGYRLTASAVVSALMAVVAMTVLPDTPTFHYPKLLLYPLTIWLGLDYMDAPTPGRAAVLGLVTAVAFLFRHDHGLYVGVAAVITWGLSRWTAPRSWSLSLRDSGIFSLAAAAVLAPWLLLVQANEGITGYVRDRADLYDMWSARGSTYRQVLFRSPLRLGDGWKAPAPKAGVVSFDWEPPVSDAERTALEQRFGLHPAPGPADGQRARYEVDNIYDARLAGLRGRINDVSGLDWELLKQLRSWLPTLEPARWFLAQITLIVPFLLLASVGFDVANARRLRTTVPSAAPGIALGALFLIVVDARLFREPSYAHLVAPLTAALAARFFTVRGSTGPPTWARLTVASSALLVTAYAGVACLQPAQLLTRSSLEYIPRLAGQLFSSPPIDAFASMREVREWAGQDRAAWTNGSVSRASDILLRYVHDCTAAGDHVFVAGSTPYHINYLIERPLAGGHLFWRHRWRSDPRHEAESLALLERQSVPFAMSTTDAVLENLKAYPRVSAYFEVHYTVFPGSGGRLLVDSRRMPTGQFGPFDFPCFK